MRKAITILIITIASIAIINCTGTGTEREIGPERAKFEMFKGSNVLPKEAILAAYSKNGVLDTNKLQYDLDSAIHLLLEQGVSEEELMKATMSDIIVSISEYEIKESVTF